MSTENRSGCTKDSCKAIKVTKPHLHQLTGLVVLANIWLIFLLDFRPIFQIQVQREYPLSSQFWKIPKKMARVKLQPPLLCIGCITKLLLCKYYRLQ